jgi:hypothetical protein
MNRGRPRTVLGKCGVNYVPVLRGNEAQHLAEQITEMRLLGRGIAFPDDALVGYLRPFRRVMEFSPPVAVADFSRGFHLPYPARPSSVRAYSD